jgi:NAD(P)-dependent dehydrogenase (short-subunit alcohol dehydrogenase family)
MHFFSDNVAPVHPAVFAAMQAADAVDVGYDGDRLSRALDARFSALFGREAARRLAPAGRGTVLFTRASASLRGRPGFAHFAASKAGLRMIAQAMAREFGPKGIHVAHVVIDGGIDGERLRQAVPEMVEQRGEDGLLGIDAIAETYWQIHRQPRSAWAFEVDLRPFKEPF